MKTHNALLYIILPLFTALTFLALLAVDATDQAGRLPDLIAYAVELAPATMYAMAIAGFSTASMHFTGMNIDNDKRCELILLAAKGDRDAQAVLDRETYQWLAWTVLWMVVFLH